MRSFYREQCSTHRCHSDVAYCAFHVWSSPVMLQPFNIKALDFTKTNILLCFTPVYLQALCPLSIFITHWDLPPWFLFHLYKVFLPLELHTSKYNINILFGQNLAAESLKCSVNSAAPLLSTYTSVTHPSHTYLPPNETWTQPSLFPFSWDGCFGSAGSHSGSLNRPALSWYSWYWYN